MLGALAFAFNKLVPTARAFALRLLKFSTFRRLAAALLGDDVRRATWLLLAFTQKFLSKVFVLQ
jgi:hypothetical protein